MTKTWIKISLASIALLGLFAGAAGAALPQESATCPTTKPWSMALPQDYPPSITATSGVIDTTFVVRERDLCVPTWTPNLCKGTYTACTEDADCGDGGSCVNAKTCADSGESCTSSSECRKHCSNDPSKTCSEDGDCGEGNTCDSVKCIQTWGWEVMELRTYGSPIDPKKPVDPKNPNDPNLRWGYPGPTLRAETQRIQNPYEDFNPKTNPQVTPGTRVKIGLYNYLDKTTYKDSMMCNPATYQACTGTTTACTSDADCKDGATCETRPVPQHHPECFHGDDVTNLHYHGTHVSPLPHQDYVLLSLFPYGSTGVPTDDEMYALGMYQTDINPLPWNQAPGTHWYHPHKHGSTSLQVLNGMSGGLVITGAFDYWLNGLYGDKLVDRLLIVQQVSDELNFFNVGATDYPPQILVNGFATPKIHMRPGEIQRWRFVGATMQASATLEIGLDPRITNVFQIAQDGVQFAWQNYARQPYRDTAGTYVNFKLFPGNRADFLIQAPTTPGTYSVDSRVVAGGLAKAVQKIFEPGAPVAERVPPTELLKKVMAADRPPVDESGNPLLFTIEVKGAPVKMRFPSIPPYDDAASKSPPQDPNCAKPQAQRPSWCWRDMPSFLADLPAPKSAARKIDFSIDGEPGAQPNSFWINDSQYDASCAGASMELGATEDWQVANKLGKDNLTMLPHPFHIHINPFQVIENADRDFDPPYVWQDTIALPTTAATDRPAGPIWNDQDAKTKCPRACDADNATWNGQWTTTIPGQLSVCGCVQNEADVLIRHRFDDYTGAYVIHCHFLGHEDRGMMWNVQTYFQSDPSRIFCTPQTNGLGDVCPGNDPSKAFDDCEPQPGY